MDSSDESRSKIEEDEMKEWEKKWEFVMQGKYKDFADIPVNEIMDFLKQNESSFDMVWRRCQFYKTVYDNANKRNEGLEKRLAEALLDKEELTKKNLRLDIEISYYRNKYEKKELAKFCFIFILYSFWRFCAFFLL